MGTRSFSQRTPRGSAAAELHAARPEMGADFATAALLAVGQGMAIGVRALVPTCACGVVVRVGDAWQLVGWSGGFETRSRCGLVEGALECREREGVLITTFATRDVSARLVLIAEHGDGLPVYAPAVLETMTRYGGELLDRAVASQRQDRRLRRAVAVECCDAQGAIAPSIGALREQIASLWPGAIVTFAHPDGAGLSRRQRRIIRAACDRGVPAADDEPARDSVVDGDALHVFALPVRRRRGAYLVEAPRAGEELDLASVAAAAALVHASDRGRRVPYLASRAWLTAEQQRRADVGSTERVVRRRHLALVPERDAGQGERGWSSQRARSAGGVLSCAWRGKGDAQPRSAS